MLRNDLEGPCRSKPGLTRSAALSSGLGTPETGDKLRREGRCEDRPRYRASPWRRQWLPAPPLQIANRGAEELANAPTH